MNKLEGLKAGDRVKVTFDGVIDDTGFVGGIGVGVCGGARLSSLFSPQDIDSPSFTIEKLPDPIKVGDRVKNHLSSDLGEVLAIHENKAWFWGHKYGPTTAPLANLERIDQ